jgi:hypothetical protein
MNISIDIHEVAQDLTDEDKLYKSLRQSTMYVKQMRASADYQRRYEHYVKIMKKHAKIKA